jgi:serine/threonine protein phosphatase PrpC
LIVPTFPERAANSPDDAETFCTKIEAGDVIVLGSDGLWDNLEKVVFIGLYQLANLKA